MSMISVDKLVKLVEDVQRLNIENIVVFSHTFEVTSPSTGGR